MSVGNIVASTAPFPTAFAIPETFAVSSLLALPTLTFFPAVLARSRKSLLLPIASIRPLVVSSSNNSLAKASLFSILARPLVSPLILADINAGRAITAFPPFLGLEDIANIT